MKIIYLIGAIVLIELMEQTIGAEIVKKEEEHQHPKEVHHGERKEEEGEKHHREKREREKHRREKREEHEETVKKEEEHRHSKEVHGEKKEEGEEKHHREKREAHEEEQGHEQKFSGFFEKTKFQYEDHHEEDKHDDAIEQLLYGLRRNFSTIIANKTITIAEKKTAVADFLKDHGLTEANAKLEAEGESDRNKTKARLDAVIKALPEAIEKFVALYENDTLTGDELKKEAEALKKSLGDDVVFSLEAIKKALEPHFHKLDYKGEEHEKSYHDEKDPDEKHEHSQEGRLGNDTKVAAPTAAPFPFRNGIVSVPPVKELL